MTDIANLAYSFKDDSVAAIQLELHEGGVHSLKATNKHQITAGDLMIQTLSNWGIQHVFGRIDQSSFAAAIGTQQVQGNIRACCTQHDSTAAFAASAYGKLTGRPAACLAKSGTGATNLLNGLWDANMDKAPVVAMTGQEIDKVGTFGQVAQWSQLVQRESRFNELANLACKSAILNRGVSHLIFPTEIPKLPLAKPMPAGSPKGRLPSQNIAPPKDALQSAIKLLRASERPIIIVGQGARDRMEAVVQLAEQLRAPVITTFKGKGLISDSHPLAAGVIGAHGTPVAKALLQKSDSLLVFGASLDGHSGLTRQCPTVQVDYDIAALARFQAIDVPVWGEIGVTAQALSDDFLGDMWTQDQTADVAAHRNDWLEKNKRLSSQNTEKEINPAKLFKALSKSADEEAIITVDINDITESFGRHFDCKQQAILMSGERGTTGFAFPAAIGAWSATQETDSPYTDRQIISISADDSFSQYMDEINTVVSHKINMTHILMNNHDTNKTVLKDQDGLLQNSFADYANSCGAMGIRVSDINELAAALNKALSHNGPALLEVTINS